MIGVVLIAVIVAIGSVLGPLLLARKLDQQRRREKAEDYRRQDEVAAQAARRQEEVAAQAARAAELLLASNERVATQSSREFEATQRQLEQIHVLVNSNLLEAQERELAATKAMLVTATEVVELKRMNGIEPSAQTLDVIELTQARVDALTRDLQRKIKQTEIGEDRASQRKEDDS